MPSLWGTLTHRGRLVGLVGLGLALAAWWLRTPELLWLAAALLLLVLGSVVTVALGRPRDVVAREIARPLVVVGDDVDVTLQVTRRRGSLPAVRIYEDDAPAELGGGPRFRLPAFGAAPEQRVEYRLRALRRGRYRVGPLAVDVRDPFGLARVDFAHGAATGVLVAPRTQPLPAGLLAGQGSHPGGDAPQRLGISGEDDIVVREYRHGDSLRRVHWRSSAKTGELMVRREEQTWEESATVVLDTRLRPHAGDSATDSFEWAVAAATSLGLHLNASGRRVDLLGPRGPLFSTPGSRHSDVAARALLEAMAAVELEDTPQLAGAAAALGTSPAQLVVALLAQCSAADAMVLSDALGQRRRGVALILETPTFGRPHGTRQTDGEALLTQRGWQVAHVRADDDLVAVLRSAGRASTEVPS